MKICVITDDNSGINPEEAKKLGVKVIRMPIIIDGEVYFENETIDNDTFYKYLEENKDIKTSQPSPGEVISIWEELLKEYDALIHITMSSGLSDSCQSAKMLSEDYKDKVFVVDNHRISVTLKQSILDCLTLISKGYSPLEIKNILEEEKSNSLIFIMVDTLKYLKKGGRVTAAGAALGATLHIKPVLTITGGKLDAYSKAMGTKKAKKIMLDAIKKSLDDQFKDINKDDLVIDVAYTYDKDSALLWANEISEYFDIKKENMKIDPLSLSVATHIGPGSLAIAISKVIK